jgi:hypothetical protein
LGDELRANARNAKKKKDLRDALTGAAALLTPVLMFLALYIGATRKPNIASDRSHEFASAVASPQSSSPTPAKPAIEPSARGASAAVEAINPQADLRPGCAPADPALGLAIVNREDVAVFANPGRIPLETWDKKPLLLDPRYEFHILEQADDWVRVRIQPPPWPPNVGERSGWIERKFIQHVSTLDEKRCLFVDVSGWSVTAQLVKDSIHEVALKILWEDHRCARLSRGGYIGQGQRFFLTCYPNDGGRPYHYWFSITDDLAKRNFIAPPLMSPKIAEERCNMALRKAIARRAKIAGGPADVLNIASRKVATRNGVHYVTLNFTTIGPNRGPEDAYCLAPPSGDMEVTLNEQN